MKKLAAFISVLVLVMFAGSVFAQSVSVSNIGYIDVQKVFKEFKEAKNAQEKLSDQEKEFKKTFEESEEKLLKARQEGKGRDELEKMKKELEQKLEPKREQLLKMNEQLTSRLQQKIVEAVKRVSKKIGVEVVVDKQVVITGGMDITELVISDLNK